MIGSMKHELSIFIKISRYSIIKFDVLPIIRKIKTLSMKQNKKSLNPSNEWLVLHSFFLRFQFTTWINSKIVKYVRTSICSLGGGLISCLIVTSSLCTICSRRSYSISRLLSSRIGWPSCSSTNLFSNQRNQHETQKINNAMFKIFAQDRTNKMKFIFIS